MKSQNEIWHLSLSKLSEWDFLMIGEELSKVTTRIITNGTNGSLPNSSKMDLLSKNLPLSIGVIHVIQFWPMSRLRRAAAGDVMVL